MARYPKALILFTLSAMCWALSVGLGTASSEGWVWLSLGGIPVLLFLAVWALRSLVRMRKQQHWRVLWLLAAAGLSLGLPAGAGFWAWRWVHPPGIRYEFSYGQSGSWAAVQFTFLENGVWQEGPWVGGWHMDVRFPDLNGDGHADLQVSGRKRLAEYVYLPEAQNGCWWHLVQNSGFQVSYPPDGHTSP